MKSDQLPLISKAASIIRDVIGCEFEWETPGHREYGKGAVMLLIHEPGSVLRPYCDYDCYEYDRIEQMTAALDAIGLYVEDCTGDYSGVYEVSHA
jgi:hypothetical protein